jgi:hypothetical protein
MKAGFHLDETFNYFVTEKTALNTRIPGAMAECEMRL